MSCPRAAPGEEECHETFCPDCGLPRCGATGRLGPLRLVVDAACGSHVAISCFDGPSNESATERVGTLMLEPETWRRLGGGDLLERLERLGVDVELHRDCARAPWTAVLAASGKIEAIGEGETAEAALRDALERAEALRA